MRSMARPEPGRRSAKIVADDGAEYDQFGQSVAMQGGNALVGQWSHNDDLGGTQPPPKPGTVYLYSASRGNWNLSNEFHARRRIERRFVRLGRRHRRHDAADRLAGNGRREHVPGRRVFLHAGRSAVADVGPASLSFSLAPGASGSSTLSIGNTGGSDLTFAIAETPANAPRIALDVGNAARRRWPHRSDASARWAQRLCAVRVLPRRGRRAMPTARSCSRSTTARTRTRSASTIRSRTESAGDLAQSLHAAERHRRFTIDTISIEWPDNPNGSLVGKSVNLVAYYDADGDGDPSNAVRLGGDTPITIASLDAFLDYTVNFAVPGDGDIYVGFENTYALGGTTPIFYPAAIDENASQDRSWVAGMSTGDPDPDDLANDDLIGTIDSFGLPGNWLIRATGIAGGGGGDCSNPSDVPWLRRVAGERHGRERRIAGRDRHGRRERSRCEGNYAAVLCVTTNDPDHALVAVPVSLTVTIGDRIFADGFDGAP